MYNFKEKKLLPRAGFECESQALRASARPTEPSRRSPKVECFLISHPRHLSMEERTSWHYFKLGLINTKKYHVFAPIGRFQLESIYLYFPPSSHLLYLCFCPVGLSLL